WLIMFSRTTLVTCWVYSLVFFFSSRRRHTRFSRDWSSDVCSSDLLPANIPNALLSSLTGTPVALTTPDYQTLSDSSVDIVQLLRSEERRVGKECKSRKAPEE